MYKVDLHTHTIASGHAINTVFEMAKHASKLGIQILGITEHGPLVLGAPELNYFGMFKRYPHNIEGVRILYGVEANVVDEEGNLDIPDDILERQDIVLAGLHPIKDYRDFGREGNTNALIEATKNPYVKIITHPYNHLFDVDIERLVLAACENDTLLEINCSYFISYKNKGNLFDKMRLMVAMVKKQGKKVIVNSDAHCLDELGRDDELKDRFRELGLEESDIINNDIDEVKCFLGLE